MTPPGTLHEMWPSSLEAPVCRRRGVPAAERSDDLDDAAAAGRQAARAWCLSADGRGARRGVLAAARAVRRSIYGGLTTAPPSSLHQEWLAENARLIVAAEASLRTFAADVAGLPVIAAAGSPVTRVIALAQAYLAHAVWHVDEARLVAFVSGVQQIEPLWMSELWALQPALRLVLLDRLIQAALAARHELPTLVGSLRDLADCRWDDVFESVSLVDRVLATDPAGAYTRMDDASREHYRSVVADLARHARVHERRVAGEAVRLAREAGDEAWSGRARDRRVHVGFYLVDAGLGELRRRIGYVAPRRQRMRDHVLAHPTAWYLGSLLGLSTTIAALLAVTGGLTPSPALVLALPLLVLAVSRTVVEMVNGLVTAYARPRRLPALDFSEGVPPGCDTLVAVPALLLNERHVRELVMDLEIRYLGNRDPRIRFALVTNSNDSCERPKERHDVLVLCERLVGELNTRYGDGERTPFYLLHRFRAYNPAEGRWMGWERKRGKLMDLNHLLRGVRDRFPVKVGDPAALRRVQYVITLDSDTELPRDAARRLIGTLAHPLNRAVVDPVTRTVVEGYGVLQPRVAVSTPSAHRSWLATLFAGESGFDIYTRAVSDVYQDLFGEGVFTGKGIYDVDAFQAAIEHRFPVNALLSHDLIEGLFARAGLVSDVELVDDYPTRFSAYSRRRHRWIRGDWQVLRWLGSRVPTRCGAERNPLSVIGRWKIADNLRRSLVEPGLLMLLVAGWLVLPGSPWRWTAVSTALVVAPLPWWLALQITRAPWRSGALVRWCAETTASLLQMTAVLALHLVFLLHDALLAVDAAGRALARMFVTHRRLLEWETAAESNLRARGTTDVYVRSCAPVAIALGAVIAFVRPEALRPALPFLTAWASAGLVARWIDGAPPVCLRRGVAPEDAAFVRRHALSTWRYFAERSDARVHWLVPDFVREDGETALRVSPTNIGLLLSARVAAVHFGYLTLPEFVCLTRRTLETVARLQTSRGHLLNWYDAATLAPLEPRFVSTVDSGNLAAALWSLKQSSLQWAHEPPSQDALWAGIGDVTDRLASLDDVEAQTLAVRVRRAASHGAAALAELEPLVARVAGHRVPETAAWAAMLWSRLRRARAWCARGPSPDLASSLHELAALADRLVSRMDFACLYDARRQVLSIGFDADNGRCESGAYDLLASEARTACFVAIAKGDIPQDAWLQLGRAHAAVRGQRVLVSWTGTLFEYLMPLLWLRHGPGTLLAQSLRGAVAVQRAVGRTWRVPWGFSESGHLRHDSAEYGYAAIGVPDLALKPSGHTAVVVSPYAAWLAALVTPREAFQNLRVLERMGAVGRYGYYEAVDYSRGLPELVRSWMAHHQGMILASAAELLFDRPSQRAFHAEPQVRATERLLDEILPSTTAIEPPPRARLLLPADVSCDELPATPAA